MLPTILRSGILSSPYRQLYCLHFQPLRTAPNFSLIELKPHSSHPDYARLLLSRQLSASVPAYIPTEYIPAKMPALNVPNTRFEQPNSAAWRLCHWDYGPFLPVEIGGNRLE